MEFNSQIINIIQDYCMSKPLAYESRPFGEHPICYRLMGKIFVQFIPVESFYRITLKCTPDKAELYRQLFPDVVVRGYHCPPVHQPYWNTVNLDLFADLDLLLQMIDEAYDAVAASFSRKTKAELSALSELEYLYSDGVTSDFLDLCSKLSKESGEKVEELLSGQSQIDGFELTNSIHDAVVAYHNGKAVACGGLKMHDEERAEIVQLYTEAEFKGIGLEAEIIRRLEAKAQMKGYKQCIIKIRNNGINKASDKISRDKISAITDDEAYNLYKKAGYRLMTDDRPDQDMSDMVYMMRKI